MNEAQQFASKKYRLNHPDEIRERNRKYYQEHRDEIKARVREYQRRKKEAQSAQTRALNQEGDLNHE